MTSQIPDNFKIQETCIEAVCRESSSLLHVPYHFKTQDMCIEAVRIEPFSFFHVPDLSCHLMTQEMCIEALRIEPVLLACVLIILKHKKCVIRPCTTYHASCYLFLIVLRCRRCATR